MPGPDSLEEQGWRQAVPVGLQLFWREPCEPGPALTGCTGHCSSFTVLDWAALDCLVQASAESRIVAGVLLCPGAGCWPTLPGLPAPSGGRLLLASLLLWWQSPPGLLLLLVAGSSAASGRHTPAAEEGPAFSRSSQESGAGRQHWTGRSLPVIVKRPLARPELSFCPGVQLGPDLGRSSPV